MDFVTLLNKKRRDLGMGVNDFADYIGFHRSWVNNKAHGDKIKCPLREKTMAHLHVLLDIPYEVMDEYNESIKSARKGE